MIHVNYQNKIVFTDAEGDVVIGEIEKEEDKNYFVPSVAASSLMLEPHDIFFIGKLVKDAK